MKNVVIVVETDGAVAEVIGPFDSKCVARMYIDSYLVPAYASVQNCECSLVQLTEPQEKFDSLPVKKA
jgi:hypothetical protein